MLLNRSQSCLHKIHTLASRLLMLCNIRLSGRTTVHYLRHESSLTRWVVPLLWSLCAVFYYSVDGVANAFILKVGFHYPSSRAELTARELGCIFWHPSTRAVNSGSGNRPLDEHGHSQINDWWVQISQLPVLMDFILDSTSRTGTVYAVYTLYCSVWIFRLRVLEPPGYIRKTQTI